MKDQEIQEVREIRRRISEDHGHDLRRLFERYRELEGELKGAGHKFVEPAGAKPTDELVPREQPPPNQE